MSKLASLGELRGYSKEIFWRVAHACKVFKTRFPLVTLKTRVDLPASFVFDETRALSRGRQAPDGKHYSSAYELVWEELPEEIKAAIKNLDSVLRLYFGGDYLIHTSNVWRNIGIPDEFRSLDIYSQVWHYDHVVDYRNLQLFVLLSDTTEEHGPFEYLVNASETKLNKDVEKRNGAELPGAVIGKLTGKRGDGMLFATGSMPHRAGIPKFGNHRDIFSIAFFPAYTGIGRSAEELLGKRANTI